MKSLTAIRLWMICLCLMSSAKVLAQPLTLIEDGSRGRLSLDGTWQGIGVKGVIPQYPAPIENAAWKPIEIPNRSARPFITSVNPYAVGTVKAAVDKNGRYKRNTGVAAWFKRVFTAPDSQAINQRRVILYLHGVAFRSDLYLNGQHLGTSVQGLVPNSYDVTDALKPGQSNELLVGLSDRDALVDPKARTLIAPASGVSASIWGRVELQLLPAVRLDDVFVQTFVAAKKMVLEVTLVNQTNKTQTLTPTAVVLDTQQVPQCNLTGRPVRLRAGQTTTVRLTKNWLAKNLWSPDMPYLYSVKVQLKQKDQILDHIQTTFGFREFTIKGTDFYLNGRKTRLLRGSMLAPLSAGADQAWFGDFRGGSIREKVARPYNSIRMHLGFDNQHIIEAADQVGLMVVPEASWYHVVEYPAAAKDKYLPNLIEYFRRWIKLNRNHPSIVIWSLTNEHFWGRTDEAEMLIAKAVAKAVKKFDPTRPIQGDAEVTWDGVLPIINIHYPEGTAGDVRLAYPNSGLVIPNDLYWLKKGKQNDQAWRAKFKWDRPLVLGEYWNYGLPPDKMTSFIGDAIYDWQRWRYNSIKNGPQSLYMDTLAKATDVYRLQGVAGLNPWSGNRDAVMPRRGVHSLDFHPNFFAGKTTSRQVIVFNETPNTLDYAHLQCRLTVDGQTVWEREVKISGKSDLVQQVAVPIDMPIVSQNTTAILTIRMRAWSGGAFHQLGKRLEETIYILPRTDLSDVNTQDIVLLDASGDTAKALASVGLTLNPVKKLDDTSLQNAKLLIVGQHTNPSRFREKIVAFAKSGGRVIVLAQDKHFSLTTGLPEPDKRHVASRVWERFAGHPILKNFDETQFSYWRPDHLTAKFNYTKLSVGGLRYLLDCGGLAGMNWSPLVEAPLGTGTIVLSQMRLIDGLKVEPMAGALLKAMLQYTVDFTPQTHNPLRLLASSDAVQQVLKTAGVSYQQGLQGQGPILVDASHTLNSEETQSINNYLDQGGKVWLHGFDASNVKTLTDILPFKPVMVKRDKTVLTAALRSQDPIIAGLANYDFFWAFIHSAARKDYFQNAKATAPIGGDVLKLPSLDAGLPLSAPALLIKIPKGSGTILFDGIRWDKAYATEPVRTSRVVGTLAMNLGATIQLTPKRQFTYFQIDLSKYANRAYLDPTAGDGKGGWTDQGPKNDMSYFLINHTGKFNGMDVAVGAFPVSQQFAGRPFKLVDPSANNNRAIITLTGGGHDTAAPKRVDGITVNKKANTLWFLQTACWANNTKALGKPQARYVIHYDDGSSVNFDQRNNIEVADWWDPVPLPAAKVAWSGRNDTHTPIGLYVTPWENPHPDKTITTIDAVGNLGVAQIVLLAITGGVESSATSQMQLISQWDMAKISGRQIKNAVSKAGPLLVDPKASPTSVQIDGEKYLRFRNGQRLTGDTRKIPGLAKGGPMRMDITLAVEEKSPGYMGGIFQAMVYRKKGFRLVVGPRLHLSMEFFIEGQPPKSIRSKTPLDLGRMYDISIDFDGKYAKMMIDGKLDTLIETPPPSAYAGPFQMGVASGKNYYFQGVIKQLSFYKPN